MIAEGSEPELRDRGRLERPVMCGQWRVVLVVLLCLLFAGRNLLRRWSGVTKDDRASALP